MLPLLLLSCLTYLLQVPHVPVSCIFVPESMQGLQINSLTTELFHNGVMVIKKISNCFTNLLRAVAYHFFFVCLFAVLGLELRATPADLIV
jgi:hypothetical protein